MVHRCNVNTVMDSCTKAGFRWQYTPAITGMFIQKSDQNPAQMEIYLAFPWKQPLAILSKNKIRQTAIYFYGKKRQLFFTYPPVSLWDYLFMARLKFNIFTSSFQKKILKKGEILLEYLVLKVGVYIFLVSNDEFEVVKLQSSLFHPHLN